MTLGQELKQLRVASGRTLRQVERETAISNGYLSQLESDQIKQPSPKHLQLLADLYGGDYSVLMRLTGYAAPQISSGELRPPLRGLVKDAADLTDAEATRVRDYIKLLRAARGAKRS